MIIKIISFSLTLFFIIDNAQAVSLTTHRIYMDNEKRSESFLLMNRSTETETCKASLTSFKIDKAGKLFPGDPDALPHNHGKNNIKFIRKMPYDQ